jgi:thiamine transport system permease protein
MEKRRPSVRKPSFKANGAGPWWRILPWMAPLLFLALFFFYPIGKILWLGLNPTAITGIDPSAFGHILGVIGFTFYQAFLSTLLTLALGLPSAFLFSRFDFKGRRFLRLLTAIPFMLPTVVVAAGFNALLGQNGWVNLLLVNVLHLSIPPIPFIGTLGAILLAHVFYNTTIVIRLVGNSLSSADVRLGQAARTLGAKPFDVFWRVTLPLLKPSLLAASLLVFIFDFTSFGVILLLGGVRFSTLEVEIYRQVIQGLNLSMAALLSLIQLIFTLIFSIIYSRVIINTRVASTPHPEVKNLEKTKTFRQKIFPGLMTMVISTFFILPLVSIPIRSLTRLDNEQTQRGQVHYGLTTDYYQQLFINPNDSIFYVPPFAAIGNSLGFAAVTVVFSLALGIPVAAALRKPGRFERLMDPLFLLPLGASAVTLGLGFIVTFNKPPLFLVTSPVIIPLAHTLIALPFVIRSLQPALASIPDRLKQAAATLGASPLRAWFAVDWPIVGRATLSAAIFAFTVSLGEFGAASLIVRPEFPTLPVAIARFLSRPGSSNYGQAMALAAILMLVCGTGIALIERLRLPGRSEF